MGAMPPLYARSEGVASCIAFDFWTARWLELRQYTVLVTELTGVPFHACSCFVLGTKMACIMETSQNRIEHFCVKGDLLLVKIALTIESL